MLGLRIVEGETGAILAAQMSSKIDPNLLAAHTAHLRYVHDDRPGITRHGSAKAGYTYKNPDGSVVKDKATLERIHHLVLPPAYKDVWICPIENGHLQATGKDARGRKQYRYHERWREVRDESKYHRMTDFAKALPKIRVRVDADLRRQGLPREKVLATIVYLLEKTCIRIGNDEYAHANDSYGLTTMLENHVAIKGSTLRFKFRGKSGKEHDIALHDDRVAKIVRKCHDLPGHELFHYQDHDGKLHHVHSDDVNAYLHAASGGQHFTAKDFRTWAGTMFCAVYFAEMDPPENVTQEKRLIADVVKRVAAHLGNTPAVCRKAYIHPSVIDAFRAQAPVLEAKVKRSAAKHPDKHGLSAEETALLNFLTAKTVKDLATRKA